MWRTNLKIVILVATLLGLYTLVANSIPQVQSDVPKAIDLSNATPEELVAAGEQIFNGAGGCTTCHGLGTRAPNLLTSEGRLGPIGARCANRYKQGMSCKDYLYESLTQPTEYVVPGYQPIMPDMRRTLPPDQVWAVIAFLESNGGTVDVTPEDVQSAQSAAPAGGGGAAGAVPATASLDPQAIISANGCLACHSLHGQGGTIAPHFDGVGTRLSKDDIRESILLPNAKIARGYEQVAGVMPQTFGQQLTAAQLEALVNFLSGLK